MVQNSLVKYIREQIRAGYSTGEIKDYLLRYGYSESQVNEAFQFAYPPTEVKHVIHLSKRTVALILAVVCSLFLISAGVYVFFIGEKAPSKLLDVQTDLLSDSVEEGGSLKLTAQIFNLGKARRYDVSLRYEIYNLKDELITFKEETIALETRASSSVDIKLDKADPGNYYLRTIASYGDKQARATSAFRVVKKKTEEEKPIISVKKCPFSCDDNDECTSDYCSEGTGYECRHDKIFPCCGNAVCEDDENYENCLADCRAPEEKEADIFEGKPVWERVELIKNVAKNDKEKALEHCRNIEQTSYRYDCFTGVAIVSNDDGLCNNIEDESYKDSCYRKFADENKNSDVCAKVVKDSKRDQCYMDFATKGDYSVCDKLVNKYLKQSCESLKKLSEVKVPS